MLIEPSVTSCPRWKSSCFTILRPSLQRTTTSLPGEMLELGSTTITSPGRIRGCIESPRTRSA
jgi:hypothetical protein